MRKGRGRGRRELVLKGPVYRALFELVWPMWLSSEITAVGGFIMFFWMGNLLGAEGLAVQSLLGPFGAATGWYLGSAGTGGVVLISRSVGAQDGEGLDITAATLGVSFALWFVLAVPLGTFLNPMTTFLAGDSDLQGPVATVIGLSVLLAIPIGLFAEIGLDTINATGWTRIGVFRTLADFVFLFVLTYPLIRVFGFAGAPLAGAVASALLGVAIWWTLFKRSEELGLGDRINWHKAYDFRLWKKILAIGVPTSGGRIVVFLLQLYVVGMVANTEGAIAVGGYGLTIMLTMFFLEHCLVFARGVGIMIGQSHGAGDYGRLKEALWAGLKIGLLFGLFLTFCLRLFFPYVFPFFSDSQPVSDVATLVIDGLSWALLPIPCWQVLNQYLVTTGYAGRASTVMILSEVVAVVGVALVSTNDALTTAVIMFVAAAWIRFTSTVVVVLATRRVGESKPEENLVPLKGA